MFCGIDVKIYTLNDVPCVGGQEYTSKRDSSAVWIYIENFVAVILIKTADRIRTANEIISLI